jgi:polyhydroxybutyrate depolymerase
MPLGSPCLVASLTLCVSVGCTTQGLTDSSTGGTASGGDLAASGGGNQAASGGSAGSGGQASESGGDAGGGNGGAGAAEVPVPSPGCDTDPLPPTGGLRTLDVDGTERQYILTLPADYDGAHPYRLIFGFHGAQYDAEWVADGEAPLTGPYFGLEQEAAGSAIFVAAQALPGSWSNTGGQDLAYVEALLTSLEDELCIDESRVFATGFSAGGIMTVRLGCALGDVFRAIAPMSPNLPSDCEDGSEPIAYWTSHGTLDRSITPDQGALARGEFLERNGCSETTVPAEPEGCVNYEGCNAGSPVSSCTFEGAHVPAPFAGAAIWAFFAQF